MRHAVLLLLFIQCRLAIKASVNEHDASYWLELAQQQLSQRLSRLNGVVDRRQAKKIILFLGDGLSITTLTAARILKGQRAGYSGEESLLAVESFPYAGLSKTYCTDAQTADSACTATAYFAGIKTTRGTIGQSARGAHVEPITQWAQRAGKGTGLVTTTRVTHASPAAGYAHVAHRSLELDIARQLVDEQPGCQLDVLLGGGLGKFGSERTDRRDLLQQWQATNPGGCVAKTLSELNNCLANSSSNSRLLGLFNDSHMAYHMQAPKEQPRLCEMTAAAIAVLEQQVQGYFLFIEGGRIDHGHHETKAGYALDETLELDAAIETAVRQTDANETLIVVTSDHSHTLSMAGYAKRGWNILGVDKANRDMNGVPYSTLNYALGSWQSTNKVGKREDPTPFLSETSRTPSYISQMIGAHAGEDVAIFAQGPQAQLFSGIMEQNLLPHLMGYAACLGRGQTLCKQRPS